jgi:prepilin-type N-terminal cleavage/methylation domain-containing protein
MRNDSGFSVVELVVVIAILGILTTIAVPNFVAWIPKYRVKDAAQDLYSNIQLAKMEAIKRNQNCTVTFDAGADNYQISLLNRTITLADYGSGVQYAAAPVPAAITFNSRGFADSAVNVTLTNAPNSASYQLSILTSGVVTIDLL